MNTVIVTCDQCGLVYYAGILPHECAEWTKGKTGKAMNTTTENYCIDCKQVAASDCESHGHVVGTLDATTEERSLWSAERGSYASQEYVISREVQDPYREAGYTNTGVIARGMSRSIAEQIISDHRLAALVPQLEKASTRTTERLKDLPRYLESNGMGTMASIVSDCLEELRVASATAKGATE